MGANRARRRNLDAFKRQNWICADAQKDSKQMTPFLADVANSTGNNVFTFLTGAASGSVVPLIRDWIKDRKEKRELDSDNAQRALELKMRDEADKRRDEADKRKEQFWDGIIEQMQGMVKALEEATGEFKTQTELGKSWHEENQRAIAKTCKANCAAIMFSTKRKKRRIKK